MRPDPLPMNALAKSLLAALLAVPACSPSVDDLSSGTAMTAGAAGAITQTGGRAGQAGAAGAVAGAGGANGGTAGTGGAAGTSSGFGGNAAGGNAAGGLAGIAGASGSVASGSAGTSTGGADAGGAGASGTDAGGATAGGASGTSAAGAGGAAGTSAAGSGGTAGSSAGASAGGNGGGGGSPAACGNGLIDVGEECEPAFPAGGPPCDPITCRRDCVGEQRYRDSITGACFFVARGADGNATNATHTEASALCISLTAQLATFEDDALRGRVAKQKWNSDQLWVNARQNAKDFGAKADDGWTWQTPAGPIAIAPSTWRSGEPNDGGSPFLENGNEDCGQAFPKDDLRLNDQGCNTKRSAICVASPHAPK